MADVRHLRRCSYSLCWAHTRQENGVPWISMNQPIEVCGYSSQHPYQYVSMFCVPPAATAVCQTMATSEPREYAVVKSDDLVDYYGILLLEIDCLPQLLQV